jgi:hypothetical protein
MGTVFPTFVFDKLDVLLLEFEEHDKLISAGVATVGEAAAYAEVWEWGNVRQTQPGPKTTLGTNPDGEQVWLSIQAPFGYIKIHESRYWEFLKEELEKVEFKSTTAQGITDELEKAAIKAMKRVADLIGESAPVDKGTLSDSFRVVLPGDILLDDDDTDDERTLLLEGGHE